MTAWQRVTTKERRAEGKTEWEDMRQRGRDKESEVGRGGDVVLTLISLRMTSIMLPITMRKSNTFQGSLKYPYTGWGEQEEEEGKKGRLEGKQHLLPLRSPYQGGMRLYSTLRKQKENQLHLMNQHMKG